MSDIDLDFTQEKHQKVIDEMNSHKIPTDIVIAFELGDQAVEQAVIEYGFPSLFNDVVEGNLLSKQERLAMATVSEEDVDNAIARWKENPPLPEFENILDAEVVED